MKVKPMIFNTEMVKAILAGKKTVTRRPMNPQPEDSGLGYKWFPSNIVQSMVQIDNFKEDKEDYLKGFIAHVCPIACKGDLIYVRETFAALGHNDYQQVNPRCITDIHEFRYKASEREALANCKDHEVRGYKWVPSIHMPRHASRLTLKVTDVRIEQVQDISEEQAKKEGCSNFPSYRGHFEEIWDSIYQNWKENPYVWVIEFEVIHKNVDKYLGK